MTNYRLEQDIDQVPKGDNYANLENGDVEQRQDDRKKARQEIDRTIVGRVVQRDYVENPIRRVSHCGTLLSSLDLAQLSLGTMGLSKRRIVSLSIRSLSISVSSLSLKRANSRTMESQGSCTEFGFSHVQASFPAQCLADDSVDE